MKLGFTGTRNGMTDSQKDILVKVLKRHTIDEFHHGDCVGADAEAHDIAESMDLYIVVHPPVDPKLRAGKVGNEMRDEKPYIERNHNIVDETGNLFVAPRTKEEQVRSGTWATYRYAKDNAIRRRDEQNIVIHSIWIADP